MMEFKILGALEVRQDGRILSIPGRKERALLTLLLLEPKAVVPAERLIDRLWGERPPRTAANTLQVYVGRLRKVLERDRRPRAEPRVLLSEAGGYRLDVEPEDVDAVRFERLGAAGSEALAAERPGEASRSLREALGLWRGPPLAEFSFDEWAQAEIARLEELRLTALENTIEAELHLGRHAQLVAELESLVEAQPLRERLHRQLMLALYRSGRQAEALQAYQRLAKVFRDELGLAPSAELQRLESAILNQEPGLDAPPFSAPSRRSLPAPATPLLGRVRELSDLSELVRSEAVRLVTLTGPGGIGKTRLALALAHLVADDFAQGAAFVPLGTIANPVLVAPMIAQALDLKETPSPEHALERELREAELLLMLDNFEQVVAAASALSRLLEAAPRLTLLVTSRAPLHLAGEHEFPVPPLPSDDAVELFAERARAAKPDFSRSESDAADVAELCARLDGLPLAIELAAARSKLLSPRALLERLGDRLDLLAGARRDAPARQQTLRTTIDWSYGLLGEAEQRLFGRLAVFAGGFSLEAAEATSGDAEISVLEGLSALVDSSLLQRDGGAEVRFSMLETVREYALERLAASGEQTKAGALHAGYFSDLAAAAELELTGSKQAAWLARLELEHDNLRTADTFWHESGQGERRLRLAVALRRFWQIHGHLAEGRRIIEDSLAEHAAVDEALHAKALNTAGLLAGEQGDFVAARGFLEPALGLARALGEPGQLAAALANLGNVALLTDEPDEAQQFYAESLEQAEAAGDPRRQAVTRENLGLLFLLQERVPEAIALFEEAVALSREADDDRELGAALRSLAVARLEAGELQRVPDPLAESLSLGRRSGDPGTVVQCLEAAAGLAAAHGDASRAAALFGAADAVRESVGMIRPPDAQPLYDRWLASTLTQLGPASYASHYEQGRELPLEDACALAAAPASTAIS